MNADAFRHFFDYHLAQNRQIWDAHIAQLSEEDFTRDSAYSIGSVRDQILHLMDVDEAWLSDLAGLAIPDGPDPDDEPDPTPDRASIRARWDGIERQMRSYLTALQDDMLLEQPLEGEDAGLYTWQVLLHVVNHGTDHRAQILRQLHDLGCQTSYQDYIFYV